MALRGEKEREKERERERERESSIPIKAALPLIELVYAYYLLMRMKKLLVETKLTRCLLRNIQ